MNKRVARALALGCAITPVLSSCNDAILMSVVAGVRDGTMTTTTELINAFFEDHFLAGTLTDEGSGDDSFVQL